MARKEQRGAGSLARTEGEQGFGNVRAEGAGSLVRIGQRESRIFGKDRAEGGRIFGKYRADEESDLLQ